MAEWVCTYRLSLLLFAISTGDGFIAAVQAEDSLFLLQSEAHGTSPPVQLPSVASESAISNPSPEEERDAKRRRELESRRREEQQFRDFADGESSSNRSSWDDALGWGLIAAAGATTPFWLPMVASGDAYNDWGYFPRHPYEYSDAYMIVGALPPGFDGLDRFDRGYLGARWRTEYGTNFNHIDWLESQLLVESSLRIGADGQWRWLMEEAASGCHNEVQLGDANLFYRFAQGPNLQARIGGGVNWLHDPAATELGFNLTYALDWYPRKPFIFSFESDFGRLGHAGLTHLRATSGLTWRGCEAYLGYDYLDVGRFDLHGLVSGLRLWF
jgi:hypothetical protein